MKNITIIFTTLLLLAFAALGCSLEENKGEQKGSFLVVDKYFTNSFINKWNEASIKDLEEQLLISNENKLEICLNLDSFKNDNLRTEGATRSRFINFVRDSNILKDSINYNSMYIIELEYSGEYIVNRKTLIIDRSSDDLFFNFNSKLGSWELQKSGEIKGINVDELDKLLIAKRTLGEDAHNLESIIVTKLTYNTILTRAIVDPNKKEAELISIFFKRLFKLSSSAID